MSAARLLLEERKLELGAALGNARQTWSSRQSALVTLVDDAGRRGHGEATPLEGFSNDSFDAALAELRAIAPASLALALAASTPAAAIQQLGQPRSPSAGFALHGALLALRAQRAGHTFAAEVGALANALPSAALPSNALPPPTPTSSSVAAAALFDVDAELDAELERVRRHSRTFKLKLGRHPKRELERVRELLLRLRPDERLRLDANGTLPSEADLLPFASPFVEFIEEPFTPLGEPRPLGFPLALDETLFRDAESGQRWLSSGQVAVVVLKPMALGLLETLSWAELARRHQVDVVVSHCFDGAVADSQYRDLAALIGSRSLAMGLGAHPGLELWQEFAA